MSDSENDVFVWDESITTVWELYTDQYNVYNAEWGIMSWVDANTFQYVQALGPNENLNDTSYLYDTTYYKDKDHVYYYSHTHEYTNNQFEEIYELGIISNDPENFMMKISTKKNGSGWSKSFSAYDSEKVFIKGEVIPHADPKTFEHINPWYLDGNIWVQNYGYRKDRNNVYMHDGHYWFSQDWFRQYYTLPDVDPETFEIIEFDMLPENLWRAYYDIYTYWWVSIGYTKDASHVYYKNAIIPWADPLTWEALLGGYSVDKNYVYSHHDDMPIRMINVDVDSFQVLWIEELSEDRETSSWFSGKYYARDKNYLFYKGNIVQWADPNNFKRLNDFGFYESNGLVLNHWRVIPWVSISDFSTQNYVTPLIPTIPKWTSGISPDGTPFNIPWVLPWADVTKNYWFYVFNGKVFTPHWKTINFLDTNKLKLHELWITDDNMFYIEYYHTFGQFSRYAEHFVIKFLPKYAEIIDTYMIKNVTTKMTEKVLMEKLKVYKEKRPADYMEWWMNDILLWTLVDHVLENGYMYYE